MVGMQTTMRPHVELLRLGDCPNLEVARRLFDEVIAEVAPGTTVDDVEVSDSGVAVRLRFPGSPRIESALR